LWFWYINCACGFGKRRCLGKGASGRGTIRTVRKASFLRERARERDAHAFSCGRVASSWASRVVKNGKERDIYISFLFDKASQHFLLRGLLQVLHIAHNQKRLRHSPKHTATPYGLASLCLALSCGCRVGWSTPVWVCPAPCRLTRSLPLHFCGRAMLAPCSRCSHGCYMYDSHMLTPSLPSSPPTPFAHAQEAAATAHHTRPIFTTRRP